MKKSLINCVLVCVQVKMLANKMHIPGLVRQAPKLSLPGKLVFPRYMHAYSFERFKMCEVST